MSEKVKAALTEKQFALHVVSSKSQTAVLCLTNSQIYSVFASLFYCKKTKYNVTHNNHTTSTRTPTAVRKTAMDFIAQYPDCIKNTTYNNTPVQRVSRVLQNFNDGQLFCLPRRPGRSSWRGLLVHRSYHRISAWAQCRRKQTTR